MATTGKQRRPPRSVLATRCAPPEGASGDIWFCVKDPDGSGFFREVRIGLERREGEWACSGLVVYTDGDLTARRLGRLGFGWLREMATEFAAMATKTQPPRVSDVRRRGRLGKGDAFYRGIADLYRYACDRPARGYAGRPVQWIHETHYPDYAIATIRTWLQRATDKGYLKRRPGAAGYIPIGDEKEDA